MRRILLAGSRPVVRPTPVTTVAWNAMVERCIDYVSKLDPKTTLLITGGAQGIDGVVESEAHRLGIHCAVIETPRAAFMSAGRGAPIKRDDVMLELADVVAVWRFNKSRGSTYVMTKAGDKLIHLDDVEAK